MTRLALLLGLLAILVLPLSVRAQDDNPFLEPYAWEGCTEDELRQFAAEVFAYSVFFQGMIDSLDNSTTFPISELSVILTVMPDESTPATNCDRILTQRQFLATHAMAAVAFVHLPVRHPAFDTLNDYVVANAERARQLLAWSDSILPAQSAPPPAPNTQSNLGENRMYVRFANAVVRGCPSRSCAPVGNAGSEIIVTGNTEGEVIDGRALWYEVTIPNFITPSGDAVTGYMHESMLSSNPP